MASLWSKIKRFIEDLTEIDDLQTWDKISWGCVCVATWGLALYMDIGFWISLLLGLGVAVGVRIVMLRFGIKRALFASGVAVCVVTLGLTVGIVATSPKTVSSVVLGKGTGAWTGQYGKSIPSYMVKVACRDAKNGYLLVEAFKPMYEGLRVGERVELVYHMQSILGIWNLGPVVETINSGRVLKGVSRNFLAAGGGRGFRGGGMDIFLSYVALICGLALGLVPLFYLAYSKLIAERRKGPLGSGDG